MLSSDKLSNFSNGFIGDIYHQISKWATLYQLTSNVLPKYYGVNKKDLEKFKKQEIKTTRNRKVIFENILNPEEKQTEFTISFKNVNFRKNFDDVFKKLENEEITDRVFETNILNDIGTGNRHFLVPNYSAAMALRHYHKAIEIHSEGKEYKEMIKKMYIIDDDISNGMHNFALALERYTMNCGVIEEKMKMLRKYYKNSLSYPPENYLKDTTYD